MADYGLKCWNSSGVLTLDLTDTLSRLRYSNTVAASSNSNTTLADISGKSTIQFGVALESTKLPHLVTRSGTTITWTARSNPYYPSSSTLILVFVYD